MVFFKGFTLRSSQLLVTIALLVSCSKESIPEGPVNAHILFSNDGNYQLGVVKIDSFMQAEYLVGANVEIRGGASVEISEELSGVFYSEDPDRIYASRGSKIKLDYDFKDDTIYPSDYTSMSLLAMFYNFEKTFAFWQNNYDLSVDEFGYTTIQNDPVLKASDNNNEIQSTMRTNAAFIGGIRDLWFFKESEFEKVPFKLNRGVMAHEFFHSVFDLYFFKPSNSDRLLGRAENVIRSINEGLADFFAYIVTSNPKEIGLSADILALTRNLPVSLDYASASFFCENNPYCFGSVLASALYDIEQKYAVDRLELGRKLISSIIAMEVEWRSLADRGSYTIAHFLNHLLDQDGVKREEFCEVFLVRFNDQANTEVLEC